MSKASDDAKASAARLMQRQAVKTRPPVVEAESAAVDLVPPPAVVQEATTGDTEPVRLTVDLAPPLFDRFDEWARKATRRNRLGRSIKADVARTLIRRLLDDEELQRSVIESLTRERRK